MMTLKTSELFTKLKRGEAIPRDNCERKIPAADISALFLNGVHTCPAPGTVTGEMLPTFNLKD